MTDPQPDPSPASEPSDDGTVADAAPAEDEAAGAATTDEPAASDDYGHDPDLVGDFTNPDVNLSHLVPSDDGDPDDEEEPAETVEQDATGQAVVEGAWIGSPDPTHTLTPPSEPTA